MKKSELKSFIKENIIDTLTESPSSEEIRLEGDIDDDDVEAKAIKAAKGARGKHKKLDLAVKSLKNITTDMKSLARKYSSADDTEKEKIKDILRKKTPIKKELESLVANLEKNAV